MMQYININSNIKIFISKTFKLELKLIIMKTIKFKMIKMTKNKQTQTANQIKKTDKISKKNKDLSSIKAEQTDHWCQCYFTEHVSSELKLRFNCKFLH